LEIRHLVEIALHTQLSQFKQVLSDHEIPENVKELILSGLLEYPDHLSETFELFKTAWRTEKFLRDNFQYIPPTTVKLGHGTFQYVSVIETVKKLREDKTFQNMRKPCQSEQSSAHGDGFLLEDIEDGLLFKENKFFLRHPNALRKENTVTNFSFLNVLNGGGHPKMCFSPGKILGTPLNVNFIVQ
jgi:hypothetical protein